MTNIDIKEAISNPSKVFNDPEDVLNCNLDHDDKIKILQSWEYELRDLSVAEEENMAEGESSHAGLLSKIHDMLDRLNAINDTTGSKH